MRNDMTQSQTKMTRAQMQSEALVIQTLLSAAMAIRCTPDQDDETMTLIQMAHVRSVKLNFALDSINIVEVAS